MQTTENKEVKYEAENVYEETWNITRNKQTISVDISFETGYSGDAWMLSASWGGEEFLLTDDEENDILYHVEQNLENIEQEDDNDEA